MHTRLILATSTLLCLASAGSSADQFPDASPWEVCVTGSLLPGINEGIDGVRDKLGTGTDVLILYHGPVGPAPLGYIAGLGLFDDSRRGRVNVPDNIAHYDAQGVIVTAGLTFPLYPRLSLEARIDVRGGEGQITAKQSFSNGDFTVVGDYGTYIAAAGTIGAYYTFLSAICIGIDVGYDRFKGKSDFVNSTVTVKGDGVTAGIGIGYRF